MDFVTYLLLWAPTDYQRATTQAILAAQSWGSAHKLCLLAAWLLKQGTKLEGNISDSSYGLTLQPSRECWSHLQPYLGQPSKPRAHCWHFPKGTEHSIRLPKELPCFWTRASHPQDSTWLHCLFFLRRLQAVQGSCRLLLSGMDSALGHPLWRNCPSEWKADMGLSHKKALHLRLYTCTSWGQIPSQRQSKLAACFSMNSNTGSAWGISSEYYFRVKRCTYEHFPTNCTSKKVTTILKYCFTTVMWHTRDIFCGRQKSLCLENVNESGEYLP